MFYIELLLQLISANIHIKDLKLYIRD